MRQADIYYKNTKAGVLEEVEYQKKYRFIYSGKYDGPPISLTMPVQADPYIFDEFPSFFDGLLPEGLQLEALVRQLKIDKNDSFSQLCAVGQDLVGAVTVQEQG